MCRDIWKHKAGTNASWVGAARLGTITGENPTNRFGESGFANVSLTPKDVTGPDAPSCIPGHLMRAGPDSWHRYWVALSIAAGR